MRKDEPHRTPRFASSIISTRCKPFSSQDEREPIPKLFLPSIVGHPNSHAWNKAHSLFVLPVPWKAAHCLFVSLSCAVPGLFIVSLRLASPPSSSSFRSGLWGRMAAGGQHHVAREATWWHGDWYGSDGACVAPSFQAAQQGGPGREERRRGGIVSIVAVAGSRRVPGEAPWSWWGGHGDWYGWEWERALLSPQARRPHPARRQRDRGD